MSYIVAAPLDAVYSILIAYNVSYNLHMCLQITVSGGWRNGTYSDKVWQLDGNQWVELPSLNIARYLSRLIPS